MNASDQSNRGLGERFEQFVTDIIYERADMSPAARALAAFLRALSALFERAVRLRFFLYRTRIFRDTPLGCKVVVVGNLTVGGTGKTPVVEKMARVMAARGRKVAILSRGYKSKKEPLFRRILRWLNLASRPAPRVVCDGKKILLGAEIAGDEPFMLARNLVASGVCIVVDRDRVYAGEYAIRHFGADIIILDDGMQYLPLRGSLNLLLVDKTNPFGNGRLLPRGILREPVEHLHRGSFIFLTKSDGKPAPELIAKIREHNPTAEIIECTHEPKRLCAVFGNLPDIELSEMKGRRVATFSGIATPDKFEEFVRRYGARIAYNRRFFDHHRFTDKDLDNVFRGAQRAGAEFIITTEKDMVRLSRELKPPLPIYFLRLEIEILSDKDTFESAVERICA